MELFRNLSSSSKADDIPKEDLMHLCMKLNKRMKLLEGKCRETSSQKDDLAAFLWGEVLGHPTPPPTALDLDNLRREWAEEVDKRRWLQRHHEELVKRKDDEVKVHKALFDVLQQRRTPTPTLPPRAIGEGGPPPPPTASSTTSSAPIPPPAPEEEQVDGLVVQNTILQAEVERLKTEVRRGRAELETFESDMSSYKSQVVSLKRSLEEEHDLVVSLRSQLSTTQSNAEEKLVYIQLQLQNSRKTEDVMKAQIDKYEKKVHSLVLELEEKARRLRAADNASKKAGELEQQVAAAAMLLSEKGSMIEDMSNQLSHLRAEKVELEKALATIEQRVAQDSSKSDSLQNTLRQKEVALAKLNELRIELDEARQAVAEKTAQLTRIRGEMQVAEKLHGTRTAMVVGLENQIQTLTEQVGELTRSKTEVESKLETVTMELEHSKRVLRDTEDRLCHERQTRSSERQEREEETDRWMQRHNEEMRSLQEAQEEVNRLKKELAKKSSLAREIVNEKEAQVKLLTSRVEELEGEIASGGHSERKIMELAAAQAKRESLQRADLEEHQNTVNKMRGVLEAKEKEVEDLVSQLSALQEEVQSLRRTRKREEVNLDYLKNIVVDYMTFPSGSSERRSLEHVIATLLQFSPEDRKKIEAGNKRGLSALSPWAKLGDMVTGRAKEITSPTTSSPPRNISKPNHMGVDGAGRNRSGSNGNGRRDRAGSGGNRSRSGSGSGGKGSVAPPPPPPPPQLHGGSRNLSSSFNQSLDISYSSSTMDLSASIESVGSISGAARTGTIATL